MRKKALFAGTTIAAIAGAFLMEPLFPLGDWRWGVLAVVSMFPALVLYRREIAGYIARKFSRKTIAGDVAFAPTTSSVTVKIRKALPRSLWTRFGGWIAGQRRLKGVPDLQRCLDELIKYSGFPVTEKVTSEQIEASNALLRHLHRAAAILDEQGESHPKIEKGLTVINHTEWIEFLSKRLAQDDAR